MADLGGAGLGDLLADVDVALMVQGDGPVPRRLVVDGVDVSRAAVLPAPLRELVVTDLPREFGGVVALGTHVLREVDGEDVVSCNVVGCLGGERLVPKSHQGFHEACDQRFEVGTLDPLHQAFRVDGVAGGRGGHVDPEKLEISLENPYIQPLPKGDASKLKTPLR